MSTLSVDTIENLAGDNRFGPVRMTTQSPSGVSTVDFTSIPSYVTKITLTTLNLSQSAANILLVQIGDSGGFETTGYSGEVWGGQATGGNGGPWGGTGFEFGTAPAAANGHTGHATITKIDDDTYVFSGLTAQPAGAYENAMSAGSKALSAGPLTQIRFTMASGTFDAGSVGVIYE